MYCVMSVLKWTCLIACFVVLVSEGMLAQPLGPQNVPDTLKSLMDYGPLNAVPGASFAIRLEAVEKVLSQPSSLNSLNLNISVKIAHGPFGEDVKILLVPSALEFFIGQEAYLGYPSLRYKAGKGSKLIRGNGSIQDISGMVSFTGPIGFSAVGGKTASKKVPIVIDNSKGNFTCTLSSNFPLGDMTSETDPIGKAFNAAFSNVFEPQSMPFAFIDPFALPVGYFDPTSVDVRYCPDTRNYNRDYKVFSMGMLFVFMGYNFEAEGWHLRCNNYANFLPDKYNFGVFLGNSVLYNIPSSMTPGILLSDLQKTVKLFTGLRRDVIHSYGNSAYRISEGMMPKILTEIPVIEYCGKWDDFHCDTRTHSEPVIPGLAKSNVVDVAGVYKNISIEAYTTLNVSLFYPSEVTYVDWRFINQIPFPTSSVQGEVQGVSNNLKGNRELKKNVVPSTISELNQLIKDVTFDDSLKANQGLANVEANANCEICNCRKLTMPPVFTWMFTYQLTYNQKEKDYVVDFNVRPPSVNCYANVTACDPFLQQFERSVANYTEPFMGTSYNSTLTTFLRAALKPLTFPHNIGIDDLDSGHMIHDYVVFGNLK